VTVPTAVPIEKMSRRIRRADMSFAFHYSGEVLAGQGEMGIPVDTAARVCYRPGVMFGQKVARPRSSRTAFRYWFWTVEVSAMA
jgi:hypothetical protein